MASISNSTPTPISPTWTSRTNRSPLIRWLAARPNGIAIARRAPHPHAAMLFHDFMLSEAQEIMVKRNFIPSSARVLESLKDVPRFSVIDPKVILDEGEKWVKLYDEIIVKASR